MKPRSKPIRVFWSVLSQRFFASRAYTQIKPGVVEVTGQQFDVTDDIAALTMKYDIVFTPENAAAKEAVAKAKAELCDNGWISVDERLPEDSGHVIVCLLGTLVFVGHYNHGKKKWRMGLDTTDRKDSIVAVTHWMPLPNPPKRNLKQDQTKTLAEPEHPGAI